MNLQLHQQIRELINNSQNILLVAHIRPDGDCIGSALGMGLSLISAGKNVQIVLRDGIPGGFKHLPGSELVTRKVNAPFDLSIVLDSSDLNRIGGVLNGDKPDINIDHHVTNLNYATINFVDPQCVATAELLAKYLGEWGLSINESVAANLLNGIIADTIGFRTSNVTPATLRLASDLMEKGASLDDLYFKALIQRSYQAVSLWGKGLSNIQRDGRLVYTSLSLKDRHQANYPGNDDADLINVLSSIEDFDISLIFVQQSAGKVKVSWRAKPGWNVSQIALQFGGGGHPAAAGAEIDGAMEAVIQKVLLVTKAAHLEQSGVIDISLEKMYPPPTELGTD
jgi:bifunctional oligoribonuclease and PAP phosphatase NrnA